MPNPELDEFLTDTVTRKRSTAADNADGEASPTWASLAGVPFGLQPKSGRMGQVPYGLVPEATLWGFAHPDADVAQEDLLVVTDGPYAGKHFWVRRADVEFDDHLLTELELTVETPDA